MARLQTVANEDCTSSHLVTTKKMKLKATRPTKWNIEVEKGPVRLTIVSEIRLLPATFWTAAYDRMLISVIERGKNNWVKDFFFKPVRSRKMFHLNVANETRGLQSQRTILTHSKTGRKCMTMIFSEQPTGPVKCFFW